MIICKGFPNQHTATDWETGFSHLQKFVLKEGHARVPSKFKTEDGFKLGRWVITQRSNKAKLSQERESRLNDLVFEW